MMRTQSGFTLVEVLVSLAIFAVVIIGATALLGAANTGGLLEGFNTSFSAARVSKDISAASVYLQAFQEFVDSKGSANATPGSYCVGSACSPAVALPSGLTGYPTPPGQPYQLAWTKLNVLIERWHWDAVAAKYCLVGPGCGASSTTESVTRVRAILTWQIKGVQRTITVERFIL